MGTFVEMVKAGGLPDDFADFVDVESGLKRVIGNQAIYTRLIKSFVSGGMAEQLTGQVELNDFENAAGTAHSIKGVAGNLSLDRLYESTVKLESRLKQGDLGADSVQDFLLIYGKTREYIQLLINVIENESG